MEKFIGNAQLELIEGEAFAGVALNPTYVWGKAIVTDYNPNGNKQRVPQEEFANIVTTGKYSPIKMSDTGPSGHFDAMGRAIGVFTDFVEVGNQVHTLIAFWSRERESAIAELKKQLDEGYPPQISWELYYDPELSDVDEDGIQNLRGISFNGAAIVNNPAYAGRTPIYAFASQDEDEQKMDLEQRISELEGLLSEKDTALAEKDALIAQKEAELNELRSFKESIEAEAAKLTKLDSIKSKFAENKINKPDTYFDENQEMLLGLSENALDFVIQEMVSFASASLRETSDNLSIPNLPLDSDTNSKDPKKLASALRAMKHK